MTPAIPMPIFRPHVLTVLESRRTLLRRCARRALLINKQDAAAKWHGEAQEIETMIDMVRKVMMKGAAA